MVNNALMHVVFNSSAVYLTYVMRDYPGIHQTYKLSDIFINVCIFIRAVGNLHAFKGPHYFDKYGHLNACLSRGGFGVPANIADKYIVSFIVL